MQRTASKNTPATLKLLLIGEAATGKTSLLWRWTQGIVPHVTKPTVGIDFRPKTVVINGHEVEVRVWDTAGHERFRSLTQAFFRGSNGIAIVFGVDDRASFNEVEFWHGKVNETMAGEVPQLLLCGNKCDLVEQRLVSAEDAHELAGRLNMEYFEVSAMTGEGVDVMFLELARKSYFATTGDAAKSPVEADANSGKGCC